MPPFLRALACVLLGHELVGPADPAVFEGYASSGIAVAFARERCARCGAMVFVALPAARGEGAVA